MFVSWSTGGPVLSNLNKDKYLDIKNKGKERGYLLIDEINKMLHEDSTSGDEIDELFLELVPWEFLLLILPTK